MFIKTDQVRQKRNLQDSNEKKKKPHKNDMTLKWFWTT